MNYNNDNNDNRPSPFKKGRLKDVVTPKSRYTRASHKSDKEAIDILTVDLVQVFADVGIHLKTVHTIAKGLTQLGWTKIKKVKG